MSPRHGTRVRLPDARADRETAVRPRRALRPASHPAQRLQRLVGNRAIEPLLRSDATAASASPHADAIQADANHVGMPRIVVGLPGSGNEREADRIAASMALRAEAFDAADRRPPYARDPVVTPPLEAPLAAADPSGAVAGGFSPDREFGARLQQARRGGAVLADRIRDSMEAAFEAPLRSVRIHADSLSDELNASLGARAFTVGEHVFFARGHDDLSSSTGKALLAHELTHVLQQRRMQALHGRESTTLIQRALADHTSFSLTRLDGFKDRDDAVSARQFIRERVGPGTAAWNAATALELDRYEDYMAGQEHARWDAAYVGLQKAMKKLQAYWDAPDPVTADFRQNWQKLCSNFDIVEAGVLAVSAQPSQAQLVAEQIWADMKRQFDRWVNGGATHLTRGAWWGSAAPGNPHGATAIPRTAMPYLHSLIEGTTWRYTTSDTSGMGFHRRSDDREDFIYHTLPP